MVLSIPEGRDGLALWLVPVADLGGVARHVLDAVTVGIPGWRIVVMCPPGPLAQELGERGAAVITGSVSHADGPRTAVAEVRRVLHRLRPDLLHTHLAFADLIGVAAVTGMRSGRGQRIRLVTTEHGIAGRRGYYQATAAAAQAKLLAHRARLHRTDALIAVCDSTREQVLAQWGSGVPITVVPNGIDKPRDLPTPQAGLRVLSLARLAPEKRIDHLLEALAVLATEGSTVSATIAGTGPEEASLRQRAEKLGLGERVVFPGHVNAGEALRTHDVVVQLSDWENHSYTLLDAVVHGLGVVATDVGGNAEILPRRCLVDGADARAVARLIRTQGEDLAQRPGGLPAPWSVRDMTAAIAGVYAGVFT